MRTLFFLLISFSAFGQDSVFHVSYLKTPVYSPGQVIPPKTVERLIDVRVPPNKAFMLVEVSASPLTVDAATFVENVGVYVSGGVVGGVDRDDWIRYTVELPTARTKILYRYALADATGGGVEIRIGSSTATPIASMLLPVTGGWGNFVSIEIPAALPAGTIDLYLTFKNSPRTTGAGGNISQLVFE